MKKPELPPNGKLDKEEQEQLISLIQDEKFLENLAEIEKEYPYWDKFKYKAKSIEGDPRYSGNL